MIAERFPELALLAPDEQLELAAELAKNAASSDEGPELTERSVEILEERLDHFLSNPETGVSWEELRSQKES